MRNFLLCLAALTAFNLDCFSQVPPTIAVSKSESVVVTKQQEQAKVFTGILSGVDTQRLTLSLSTKESSSFLRYSYSDATKFYDNAGHALTPQSLESGSTATLTYLQTGNDLVVVKAVFTKPAAPVVKEQIVIESKPVTRQIIVTSPTPAPLVEETTTTTTTVKP